MSQIDLKCDFENFSHLGVKNRLSLRSQTKNSYLSLNSYHNYLTGVDDY